MNDQDYRNQGGVLAWVLREADHKPGTRLISDRYGKFVLIGDDLDTTFKPSDDTPPLRLVRIKGYGLHAEPVTEHGGNLGFAFGGNWLWSGDSRFPAPHPIRINDMPHSSR